ncbi:MAG: hypothetical protein ACR2JF_13910 [Iamia sp.]
MPHVLIRDLPEPVHRLLGARLAHARASMHQDITQALPPLPARHSPNPPPPLLAPPPPRAGTSLQQYLTRALTDLAEQPTVEDVLARIESQQGGRVGLDAARADLDDERRARP